MKPYSTTEQEANLDSLDRAVRGRAMDEFQRSSAQITATAPPSAKPGNLHAHTFYSYNCSGYSPTRYALLARRYGMEVAGIVDFDVLDGLDEFHAAGQRLNLRTVVSLETRVFVPEFADRVINSPGEPGVAYHMAAGFARRPSGIQGEFLQGLRQPAAARNRSVVARVNACLDPVAIAYDTDVLSLTPAGNATERHLVLAYARKAVARIGTAGLLAYWTSKLGPGLTGVDLPESPALLNLIRSKTMKQGGPGYMKPTFETFPRMADFNAFALAAGAMPMAAWLDGTSAGEQAMDELARVAASTGACALNVIPDRNFTPGRRDGKLENLYAVMELARNLRWPVIAGTEMNSHGQRFVDQFDAAELRPLVPDFQRGARIVYAHTALQRAGGFGYLGAWADRHLPRREDRNEFFERLGMRLTPATETRLRELDTTESPEDIERRLA